MIFSETIIRVRYADTDQMRFAYYGKFFEYFEQGRSDLLRQVGLPYPEIEKMGYFLPVVEAHANYSKPAFYDNELNVRTILKEIPNVKLRIEYEVFNKESGDLLATGHTIHSFIKSATGKPTRVPEEFLRVVREVFQLHSSISI